MHWIAVAFWVACCIAALAIARWEIAPLAARFRAWLRLPEPHELEDRPTHYAWPCTECGRPMNRVTADVNENASAWLCHGTDDRPCCTMNRIEHA